MLLVALRRIPPLCLFAYLLDCISRVLRFSAVHILQSNISLPTSDVLPVFHFITVA